MSPIYWLASYPKSGNTWVRTFLHNYWFNGDAPYNINRLDYVPGIAARDYYDNALMIESGLLKPFELDLLRPMMCRRYATLETPLEVHLVKVHDAFRRLPNGEPIFPSDVTGGVIHIVRNPLDVAISYANHSSSTIDQSIDALNTDTSLAAAENMQPPQLRQVMLSWSDHARSWMEQSELRRITVRYEDLLTSPHETFTTVLRFIGWEVEAERLEKAIRFSSFGELKKQEEAEGFHERPPSVKAFFREGKAGGWQSTLTEEQVQRLVECHHEMMTTFGYLPLEIH